MKAVTLWDDITCECGRYVPTMSVAFIRANVGSGGPMLTGMIVCAVCAMRDLREPVEEPMMTSIDHQMQGEARTRAACRNIEARLAAMEKKIDAVCKSYWVVGVDHALPAGDAKRAAACQHCGTPKGCIHYIDCPQTGSK